MDSSAASSLAVSPASDDRFWDGLRTRVDTILEDRRLVASAASTCAVASGRPKRLREDSLMLVRGLDSVAASLAQLSDTLTAAQKGVNALAMCSSQARERERGEEEPDAKRHCRASTEFAALDAKKDADEALGAAADAKPREEPNGDVVLASAEVAQSTNLKRARSLAVSMAGRAANLARELTTIKSELRFMQERCGLLEEENRRLRDGYDDGGAGAAPEEDDLVRLQLEALLAEKSRLAQENANLARENQSLVQLVEYHQLTAQEEEEEEDHLLTASYEEAVMQGMRLDFSSPLGKLDGEGEFDGVPATPGSKLGVLVSPDE
ncbi:unnamed protein product [Triticum turgidum subsp. durum]|uniref:Uncharacterized protein n=1 Tax=Triticum turgidum subsp. durum TaxID=4567 RepID=A0A9R1PD73_TRITD|nr:unnamed protein product [Triticum turgidum subsp. durum]